MTVQNNENKHTHKITNATTHTKINTAITQHENDTPYKKR